MPLSHPRRRHRVRAVSQAVYAAMEGLERRTLMSAVPINYTLAAAGKVSLGVYNSSGVMVRTVLSAQQRPAGAHTEIWDGLDDRGNVAPAGTYSYKLLQLTAPLKGEYLTTVGNSYPSGPGFDDGAPGNHDAATAVAIDATGIYVGAGEAESVATDLKMSPDGTARLWTNDEWPTPWHGVMAIASTGDKVYYLYSNLRVGVRNVATNQTKPFAAGSWDVRWRSTTGTFDPVPNGGSEPAADMAVRKVGTTTHAVVSYEGHDEIFWFDPANGNLLDRATVSNPRGVAVDKDGSVLVISDGKVVRLSRTNKTPQTVISGGLTDPKRLDVDPQTTVNQVLVADGGGSQQVKRFNLASGTTNAPMATYGIAGGRQYGLYANQRRNFRNVTDIAVDATGGFIVAEPDAAPRRTARFDANGNFVKEWVGGTPWNTGATFEPDNPGVVWAETEYGELTRFTVDPVSKTWQVHSNYRYDTFTNLGYPGPAFGYWNARKHNGTTYLVRSEQVKGLRLQVSNAGTASEKWELLPAFDVKVNESSTSKAYIWADNGAGAYGGNGQRDPGETIEYKTGLSGGSLWGAEADGEFNYTFYDEFGDRFFQLPVTGWGSYAPVFRPLGASATSTTSSHNLNVFSTQMLDDQGLVHNKKNTYPFYRASGTSAFYAGMTFGNDPNRPGDASWGRGKISKLGKWDANGRLLWQVGQAAHNDNYDDRYHTVKPGEIWSDFRAMVGSVNNTIVLNDFNGGYDGHRPAMTYVWDADGLFVGGLFDAMDLSGGKTMTDYALSSENANGEIVRDPTTGAVYYVAQRENENRLYRITGWDNWVRQSGTINNAAAWRGSGLTARYYDNPDFTNLRRTRIDGGVGFRWGTGAPAGAGLTSGDSFSVRWTGQVSVPTTGRYTYYFNGDDGSRLWINGRQVLENWRNGSPQQTSHSVYLEAGKRYDIRLDYFENTGTATAELQWSGPGITKQDVPVEHLFPTGDVPVTNSFLQGPGTIQAEDYDEGGEGAGYHDHTVGRSGFPYHGYRQPGDDVDIEAHRAPSAPNFVNYEVLAKHGEWYRYTFDLPTGGTFDLKTFIRTDYAGASMLYEIDGVDVSGALTIPDTNWSGSFVTKSGVSLTAGKHTLRVVMNGTDTAAHAGNFDYVQIVPTAGATSSPSISSTLLTGRVIGTTGSYRNAGNTRDRAFDGNLTTFFDAPETTGGNGTWVGLDLGTQKTITSVRFAPRGGWSARMVGGRIQVSDTADFSSGVQDLYTIGTVPREGTLTTVGVQSTRPFRYVRYLSPSGGWGNIAELQVTGY